MSVLNQDPHGRVMALSPEYIGDEDEFEVDPNHDRGFDRRTEQPRPSGPFANDDDPRFSAYWRQSARPEPISTRYDIIYGVLVAIATAIAIGAILFFVPNATGAAGAQVSVVSILVPSVGLGLLSIVMSRLTRLSNAIDRNSRKIEIAQHAIAELDSVRTTFQNEVAFVNQALQINRNFISTRMNTIKADFEGAALSSARILEGRISEIAHNFKESVLHDTSIQTNWNMIISATEKIIEILNSTPGQLDRHIQDKTSALQAAIEVQMNLMAKRFEVLSQDMTSSQGGVEKQMADAIDKIREHVGVVQNTMSVAVEVNSEKQAQKYESVLQEIRTIGGELTAMTQSIPKQLTLDVKSTEATIEQVVDKAMRSASIRLDETVSSVSRSNASLSETLTILPARIEDYITSIAPAIAASINENGRRSETRIIEVVKRSVVEGQAHNAHIGPQIEKIGRDILDIENRMRTVLDVNRQGVETLVDRIPEEIKRQISSTVQDGIGGIRNHLEKVETDIKTSIAAIAVKTDANSGQMKDQLQTVLESVQAAVNVVSGSVNGITSTIGELNGSVQQIQSSIKSVGGTLDDADKVIAGINAVTAQFRDISDNRMDNVHKSIESSLVQFDEAMIRQRNSLTQSVTSDLVSTLSSTQGRLAQDYQAIEERLTGSLSNFNEIVQNCIRALEETVVWKQDTFDQQIKQATEQNIETAKAEIEQLTHRLQNKVKEANLTNVADHIRDMQNTAFQETIQIQSALQAELQDEPDQDLIEKLTKKLANIDSILGELRRETDASLEDEKA